MQITQVIAFLAVAIVGAVAVPGGHPPPPPSRPTSVVQQITCSGNSSPYCCSPSQSGGTTCTGLIGSSVNCNGITICCNNNEGAQNCFASISGPVTVIWSNYISLHLGGKPFEDLELFAMGLSACLNWMGMEELWLSQLWLASRIYILDTMKIPAIFFFSELSFASQLFQSICRGIFML